jgi:hypothetical protein
LVVMQFELLLKNHDRLYHTDRHPEIPSMRARLLQRPNRVEGPFVFDTVKHKVSQGYSPADENAGSLYAPSR